MSGFKKLLQSVPGKRFRPYCVCIVPAAGEAKRMGGIDKILADIGGEPVILRTLRALEACDRIDEIVVVTREDLIRRIGGLVVSARLLKVKNVIKGGENRTESVWLGLQAANPKAELIAVHDGARPFADKALLTEVLRIGADTGSAAPAVPVKDTIKKAAPNRVVTETPARKELYAVQTPQVFDKDLFTAALDRAVKEGWELTDDCSVMEKIGMSVTLTAGSEENIKITTPLDLALGEAIAAWQEQK